SRIIRFLPERFLLRCFWFRCFGCGFIRHTALTCAFGYFFLHRFRFLLHFRAAAFIIDRFGFWGEDNFFAGIGFLLRSLFPRFGFAIDQRLRFLAIFRFLFIEFGMMFDAAGAEMVFHGIGLLHFLF